MPRISASDKTALGQLARLAEQRELAKELSALKQHYQHSTGSLEGFEQSTPYHQFTRSIATQITTYYRHVEPELCVAKAVTRNLLLRSELPATLAARLADTIDYYLATSESLTKRDHSP